MNKSTKLFSTILALTLLVTLPAGAAFAADVTYTLKAGQHIEVGTVTVSKNGTNLDVVYKLSTQSIIAGWSIVQAHLYRTMWRPRKALPDDSRSTQDLSAQLSTPSKLT